MDENKNEIIPSRKLYLITMLASLNSRPVVRPELDPRMQSTPNRSDIPRVPNPGPIGASVRGPVSLHTRLSDRTHLSLSHRGHLSKMRRNSEFGIPLVLWFDATDDSFLYEAPRSAGSELFAICE